MHAMGLKACEPGPSPIVQEIPVIKEEMMEKIAIDSKSDVGEYCVLCGAGELSRKRYAHHTSYPSSWWQLCDWAELMFGMQAAQRSMAQRAAGPECSRATMLRLRRFARTVGSQCRSFPRNGKGCTIVAHAANDLTRNA